jgi:hypothetical protein
MVGFIFSQKGKSTSFLALNKNYERREQSNNNFESNICETAELLSF